MPGNLAGFDGAAADLLPERDVGAAEGVQAQAGEIVACDGPLVPSLASASIRGVENRLLRPAGPDTFQTFRVCS